MATLLLTACGNARFGGASGGVGSDGVQPIASGHSNRVTVAGKSLGMAGPPGFCLDRSMTRQTVTGTFVLLANCKATSPGAGQPGPEQNAILTAALSRRNAAEAPISEALPTLDTFFRSEEGRRALSRSGRAETVTVHDTFVQNGAFFLRVTDNSPGILPGVSPTYWRSYFDLGDEMAALSVLGFTADPLPADDGLSTLRVFTETLRAQNGGSAVTTNLPPAAAPAAPVATAPARFRIGLFRRFFGV